MFRKEKNEEEKERETGQCSVKNRKKEKCTYLNMSFILDIDRQWSDAVPIYIQAFARLYVFFFFLLLLFFFDKTIENERIHTKQYAKGQSSGQRVRWFICIVVLNVYCRLLLLKIGRSLSYFCWLFFNLYQKNKPRRNLNLINFTKVYVYSKKNRRYKLSILEYCMVSCSFSLSFFYWYAWCVILFIVCACCCW